MTNPGPPGDPAMPTAGWVLGAAGLLPQIGVVAALAAGPRGWHAAALTIGLAYAGLILSFLGGLWWGMAAAARGVPNWVHVMATVPSVLALAAVAAVTLGWPIIIALVVIGLALIATLVVDQALTRLGICPLWWLRLRVPLSCGLGGLTLLAAAFG